jgi:hypothetical protein
LKKEDVLGYCYYNGVVLAVAEGGFAGKKAVERPTANRLLMVRFGISL